MRKKSNNGKSAAGREHGSERRSGSSGLNTGAGGPVLYRGRWVERYVFESAGNGSSYRPRPACVPATRLADWASWPNLVAIFLYRARPARWRSVLAWIASRFPGPIIPVIYNVNPRNLEGYFWRPSSRWEQGRIYVSDATNVEISKALQYFRLQWPPSTIRSWRHRMR
jgi:hypothetical protein